MLFDHFADAERRGKLGHGFSRIPWLEQQPFDRTARPVRRSRREWYRPLGRERRARLPHARRRSATTSSPKGSTAPAWSSPRGASRRARSATGCGVSPAGGYVALLTATSPRRLPPPSGGEPLTGTNPLAIAIPSGQGEPLVADVSMGAVTHGDVIAGRASPEELVPFGGPLAHKAFALAVGLELFVSALAGPGALGGAARRAARARPRARVPRAGRGRPPSRRRVGTPSGVSRARGNRSSSRIASRSASSRASFGEARLELDRAGEMSERSVVMPAAALGAGEVVEHVRVAGILGELCLQDVDRAIPLAGRPEAQRLGRPLPRRDRERRARPAADHEDRRARPRRRRRSAASAGPSRRRASPRAPRPARRRP